MVQVDGSPAEDELQPVLAGGAPGDDSAAAAQIHAASDTATELPKGEFDPMAILDKTDSQAGVDELGVNIEQSRHGQKT